VATTRGAVSTRVARTTARAGLALVLTLGGPAAPVLAGPGAAAPGPPPRAVAQPAPAEAVAAHPHLAGSVGAHPDPGRANGLGGARRVDAPQGPGHSYALQADVDALRAIGTVGVLAEVDHGGALTRARAGVTVLGGTEPLDWGSRFRIGSTTKTFVAATILQLDAERVLSTEDTVERWLPGLVSGRGNNGGAITVRHLLQHTSGLFDYVSDEGFLATISTPEAFLANRFVTYTPQQLVRIAVAHPPRFAPGARWDYSNTNYILAGLIIEAATGEPWAAQVRKRIIRPLGLSGTTEPGTDPALPAPHPRGYQLFGTDGAYTDTTAHNMTWGGAAGSLVSTPRDVNTFLRALMSGRLLPPAQLAAMRTTVPIGRDYQDIWPGGGYGLGIFRTDLPCGGVYWHHGGDVIGYSDTNGVTDDGARSVTVASSTNTFSDPDFARESVAGTNRLVRNALCAAPPGR